jgi:uncharacterized protein (TIGR00290 family)
MKVFSSWSGGKDCALATYEALSQGYEVARFLNMISEDGERSRSHGILTRVLDLQSEAIGIPIIHVKSSWEDYEENFKKTVRELKKEGIEGGVFGDIDLEEHREWTERVCGELGIKPIMPLWKIEPEKLLSEFLELGFRARVIATKLDANLLGKDINKAFITEIQKFNSHPCGENGEYHTFVTDGPIFRKRLKVKEVRKEKKDKVWFLEISVELGGN